MVLTGSPVAGDIGDRRETLVRKDLLSWADKRDGQYPVSWTNQRIIYNTTLGNPTPTPNTMTKCRPGTGPGLRTRPWQGQEGVLQEGAQVHSISSDLCNILFEYTDCKKENGIISLTWDSYISFDCNEFSSKIINYLHGCSKKIKIKKKSIQMTYRLPVAVNMADIIKINIHHVHSKR